MDTSFEVIDYFETSAGDIVVVKLHNINSTVTQGVLLRNSFGSQWKVIGIGLGKRPNLKNPKDDNLLIKDFRIERIYGDHLLKPGDLLYLNEQI